MTDKYGVTPQGFRKMFHPEIMESLLQGLRSDVDQELFLEPETELWQISKVFADALSDAWEVLEQSYYAKWPSTASGPALDNAMEYTADKRLNGWPCYITYATIESARPLTIEQGTEFILASSDRDKFAINLTVSLSPSRPESDQPVIYRGICSLVSAETRPYLIRADSVLNNRSLDQDLKIYVKTFINGSDREKDHEAKARRIKNTGSGARSTAPGIEAYLENKVPGVISARVLTPTVTGPDGQPAGTVQVLVDGGRDDKIAEALFQQCIATGTPMWGRQSETVRDRHGKTHVINYSRVTRVSIFILAEIRIERDFRIPHTGSTSDQEIIRYLKDLLTEQGNRLKQGNDVRSEPWLTGAFRDIPEISEAELGLSVTGIPDNTLMQTVPIEMWERAVFSPENIKVVLPRNDSVSDLVSITVYCELFFIRQPENPEHLKKDLKDRIAAEINLTRRGVVLTPRIILAAIDHKDFSHGAVRYARKPEGEKQVNLALLATEKASAEQSEITIDLAVTE